MYCMHVYKCGTMYKLTMYKCLIDETDEEAANRIVVNPLFHWPYDKHMQHLATTAT